MNTIFIGGSRHVSRLPLEVKQRLDNVVASGHRVIIGDATGADKAVQQHFLDKRYDKVIVFCTGDRPRNNLGSWCTQHVDPPKNAKGFHFYAAKDREMACEADFGLMIWDGKSPGTILNVMRMALAGKITVLFNVPQKDVFNIKTLDGWRSFISSCSRELQSDIKERATPEEWRLAEASDPLNRRSLFDRAPDPDSHAHENHLSPEKRPQIATPDDALITLNEALARGDTTATADGCLRR